MRNFTKLSFILLTGAVIGLVCFFYSNQSFRSSVSLKSNELVLPLKTNDDNEQTDDIDKAIAFDVERTKDIRLGYVPTERLIVAKQQMDIEFAAQRNSNSNYQRGPVSGITWTERGPNNIGGRTRAVAFDLNDAPNYRKVWAGGVGGGLWVTNDITVANPVWTKQNDLFDNIAIGSFAQSPSNPQNMFFGTGEGWFNADAIRGAGVWFSSNGGNTWARLASTINNTFFFTQKIVVDNAGAVYACTRDGGLQKSIDNGTSWTRVLGTGVNNVLPTNVAAIGNRAADIEIAANGDLYCSVGIFSTGAIYRSTNGGTSWTVVTPAGTNAQRIELACAPSDANTVYALFQEPNTNICNGIQRYNAATGTWTAGTVPNIIDQGNNSNFTRGQAWYDLIAAVDPNNANSLYIAGVDALRSDDGGVTWTQMTAWSLFASPGFGTAQNVHADHHNIVYRPGSSSIALWATDGGIDYTTNANLATGRPDWSRRNSGYNIAQFYSVAIHPTLTDYLIGGTQDNGTLRTTTPGIGAATTVTGGDGGFAHIDQENGNIQISSFTNNNLNVTTDAWATSRFFQFPGGSFINPTDYDDVRKYLYGGNTAGTYFRWTSPATGGLFEVVAIPQFAGANVTHVTVSPVTFNRVYFGLSNGSVVRVDNAHTATPSAAIIKTAGAPAANVSCVAIDPSNENHLLITYSNFGANSILESVNALSAAPVWNNCRGDLPDMPIFWAMFDPRNTDWAILATEMGIWSTDNLDGTTTDWGPTNNGFANTRVDMLQYRSSDRLLVAASHGRGFFSTNIPVSPNSGIRFEKALGIQTEASTSSSDCRPYTDYLVNLIIDNAPSSDAVVTLNIANSSTAVRGIDFDFTTNGNFTTPSNIITFSSSTTTIKPVTVRIYDDAQIEPTELITLEYTLSGGSNAVRGVGPQQHTVELTDNDRQPIIPFSTDNRTIGTGNFGGYFQPFRGNFQKARSQYIYLASELKAAGLTAGNITELGFTVVRKGSTAPFNGLTISLKNTDSTTIANAFQPGTTIVYTNNYTTTLGVNTFVFTNPFQWDGVSNLLVEICFDNTTSSNADDVLTTNTGTSIRGIWNRAATGVGCTLASAFISAGGIFVRPDITFKGLLSGAAPETLVNSLADVYVGPNADVFLYSNTGKILARIRNYSNFDYGCTKVIIDRAGAGALPFTNNVPANFLMNKTFRILPANNNPTGTYELTLYYTKAEIDAWKAVTGKSFNEINFVKVQKAIGDATINNPDGAGSIEVVTPLKQSYGIDSSLTYIFTTGFGGFGAGIPPALLKGDGRFKVLTNPFVNNLEVQFATPPNGPVQVRLLDVTGRLLYSASTVLGNDQLRYRVPVSGLALPQGFYVLDIRTSNRKYGVIVLKRPL
jgi:hypothetical protein